MSTAVQEKRFEHLGSSHRTPTHSAARFGRTSANAHTRTPASVAGENDLSRDYTTLSAADAVLITQVKERRERDGKADSDTETELADVDVAPKEEYDHREVGRKLYLKQCKELGVTPIGYFMRHIGDSELNLRNYSFGPVGAHALAVPLMINTSMTKLDLSGTGIQAEGAKYISDMLINNTFISDLSLANNDLRPEGIKCICRVLLHSNTISRIDLSGNQGGDKAAEYLARIMQESRYLKVMNLSNNGFGVEAGALLGPALAANDILDSLDLSYNHIRLRGITAIAKGLKENIRLKKLNMSWNGFGFDGACAMADALKTNEILKDLDVSGTRMTDEAVTLFSTCLSKNESLEILKIGENPFTHIGAFAIMKAVHGNANSSIALLDLKSTLVLEDFVLILEEIKEMRSIEVRFQTLTRRKPRPLATTENTDSETAPLSLLLMYTVKVNRNLSDMFKNTSKVEGEFIKIDDFKNTLKLEKVPLSEDQIDAVAISLDKEKTGLIDLGKLYELQKQHEIEKTLKSDHLAKDFVRSMTSLDDSANTRQQNKDNITNDDSGQEDKDNT